MDATSTSDRLKILGAILLVVVALADGGSYFVFYRPPCVLLVGTNALMSKDANNWKACGCSRGDETAGRDSTGTISPTSTGAFSAGVWSGSVTITKAQTGVTITTSGNGKSGTSNSFHVNPAGTNKLVLTTYPSSVTAGLWTSKYTVQRQDQYGNPVTSGVTTVNLASTSTGANKKFAETSGGPAVTSVTIPDGSSTKDFYYYDEKAGSWTISVSATGLTGDSKPLTVNPFLVTITSNPTGSGFVKVDGSSITTPQTFAWFAGSTHTLEALSPVSGGSGIQYVWVSWTDGGSQNHVYTVPGSSQTVTANYKTQYYLTVQVDSSGGGVVSPSSGWRDAGSSVTIQATPASGYIFSSWSGSGSGSYSGTSNPVSIAMNGPITETASFLALSFDFSVSFVGETGPITVTQGGSGSNVITVTLVSGPTQAVSLSASGLPSGATASFSPASGNPTFTSTCTITTSSSTPTGSYTITVSATGGGLTRTTSFTLTVSTLGLNQVSGAILSAPASTVYFLRTENIYDDSALGFTYAKCVNRQNMIVQTDSSKVNQVTGAPLFTGNVVLFGGRLANKVVKYYEDNGYALITFSMDSTYYKFMKGSTAVYQVARSSYVPSKEDYFVVQIYLVGSRTVFSMWGLSEPGTYASGLYFADIIDPNLASYTQGYYICKWTDLNNDGIQQSNEITLVASGT